MSRTTIAVVGLGRIARSHIDGILQWPDRCELGAVVDVDENRARAFATEFDVPYHTATEEVYANPEIDAVVICVPHHLHAPLTVEACEAGKHVLVEKVMARSVSEGREMVEAADENDVNLMVGQSRRFFPALRQAYERRREIGEAVNLLYTFTPYFDVDVAPDWWQSAEKTGGLVYPMLGSHSIDYTLWMLGEKDPVAVYAEGGSNNPDFEGHDDVTVLIRFDDGTHATNFLSINNPDPVHEGLVIGTDGSIDWEQTGDHAGELVGVASTEMSLNGNPVEVDDDLPHNFALQMREFVDSIRAGRNPNPSGEEILTQLSIIEAAKQSAEEDRLVGL
ncbi:Gfo/Idh/MocA family protein [Halorussus sp. AFM4]|uniref:Gfo/Idh/MocA family protein n=1 Tax=Halorussus sp. AFM4 TaxID=3421651 RepID=UPI003EBF9308